MRTVRCSSHLLGAGGVCPEGDVCLPPPREQNYRRLLKHYLAATTLRTVKTVLLVHSKNVYYERRTSSVHYNFEKISRGLFFAIIGTRMIALHSFTSSIWVIKTTVEKLWRYLWLQVHPGYIGNRVIHARASAFLSMIQWHWNLNWHWTSERESNTTYEFESMFSHGGGHPALASRTNVQNMVHSI